MFSCSVQLFETPMDCSTPGFPVLHYLLEFAQTHIIESVMPSNHLILGHYLFVLSSVFPNESALCIRWPKYWSFSISICPSSEYSGLISFRIDWFDLFAVQRTLKSLLRLLSIASVMPFNHLILCRPLLLLPSIFPSIRVFSSVSSLHQVAKVLELQHQSFQ